MRYLNPKADLTFKKVFGEHPNLIKSLLNALLPFERPEDEIDEIEYLAPELVPDTPLKKNSIVDVRCKDKQGRQFIVEMQILWSPAFMQRVLFNASKAYVRQLGGTGKYELLQPVYSLNLVNDIFLPDVGGVLPRLPHRSGGAHGQGHRRPPLHLRGTAQVHTAHLQREEDAGVVAALPHGDRRGDPPSTPGAAGQSRNPPGGDAD